MSSVQINDDLLERAAAVAGARGQSVHAFVADAVRHAISSATSPTLDRLNYGRRNDLPVVSVPSDTPPIDPAEVRRAIEEAD